MDSSSAISSEAARSEQQAPAPCLDGPASSQPHAHLIGEGADPELPGRTKKMKRRSLFILGFAGMARGLGKCIGKELKAYDERKALEHMRTHPPAVPLRYGDDGPMHGLSEEERERRKMEQEIRALLRHQRELLRQSQGEL